MCMSAWCLQLFKALFGVVLQLQFFFNHYKPASTSAAPSWYIKFFLEKVLMLGAASFTASGEIAF
jgi:hypothetical protein